MCRVRKWCNLVDYRYLKDSYGVKHDRKFDFWQPFLRCRLWDAGPSLWVDGDLRIGIHSVPPDLNFVLVWHLMAISTPVSSYRRPIWSNKALANPIGWDGLYYYLAVFRQKGPLDVRIRHLDIRESCRGAKCGQNEGRNQTFGPLEAELWSKNRR